MLYEYMGRSAAVAAYLPVESLNQSIAANDDEDIPEDLIDTYPDPTFQGDADMIAEIERRQVREFVEKLPDRLKTIIVRHYWLGDRQEDIANDLGVTQSAVSHAIRKVHRMAFAAFA